MRRRQGGREGRGEGRSDGGTGDGREGGRERVGGWGGGEHTDIGTRARTQTQAHKQ